MEYLLNLLEILSSNKIAMMVLIAILLNAFLPASIFIVFLLIKYGPYEGFILIHIVFLISSLIPYIVIEKNHNYLDRLLPHKYFIIMRHLSKNESLFSTFIVRLLSIPYIAQNLICAYLSKSIISFIVIQFIAVSLWIALFSFSIESIQSMRLWSLALSFVLIIFVMLYTNYLYKKIISDE